VTTAPEGVATSLDGRQFRFRSPVGTPFVPGGFVTLRDGASVDATSRGGDAASGSTGGSTGGEQLGQVDDLDFDGDDTLAGTGKLLGERRPDGSLDTGSTHPFAWASVDTADDDAVELIFRAAKATLDIGSLIGVADVRARLLAHRFNRHTFWCGQSGSGKTYALGVLLEQLLVDTALPMVIFDPNGDFVRLRELRTAVDTDDERELARKDIRVLRPGDAENPLLARFIDFPMRSKAAVLRLDPIDDRAEYNALVHLDVKTEAQRPEGIVPALLASNDPAAEELGRRIENLRLIDWDVWAEGRDAVTDVLDERPDATVLDLGGFAYPDEHLVIALAVLDDLWAKRESRRPLLIVIDEAHNLCSPDDDRPLQRAVRERIIQIAAEGRKFGLWLLLSTQRPSKVHPNIISQCDNLALMRMSSPLDLEELGTIFGFAPPSLLAHAPGFRQGEALLAGGFVPAPMLVKVRDRLTEEGGADVRVPLRSPAR